MPCLINASPSVALRRLSMSVFVALSLVLVACGGGSGTENSRLDGKSPYTEEPSGTEKPSGGDSTGDTDSGNDNANDGADDDTANDDGSDSVDDGAGKDTSTPDTEAPGGDDEPVADGGDVVEPDAGVEDPATDDDSGLVEEVVSEVSGAVLLEWQSPEFRENGEYLPGNEIGGYELRYRRLGEEGFQTVIINDWDDEDYEFGKLVGSYQFSIAAFDTNGLYSEFVSLSPVTGLLGSL